MRVLKPILLLTSAWIVLAVVGNVIGHLVFETAWLEHMTQKGLSVAAVVIKKEPENHATLTYRYTVAGTEYIGTGGAGDDNPQFDEIGLGDEIVAYYDSDDPSKSIAGNPWYDLRRNQSGAMFTTLVFPVIPMAWLIGIYVLILALTRRNRRLEQLNSV
ncbi:MAG TPA: DUF3592 domain-containing protein [Pyrinomonadaceae bacterium]|jgi:hypothetical protein|nr:DUF3592 domain-containing protein [Pyrinomonadaceae bacterium]